MKKYFVILLVVIFSVNSIAVSAWGASCPHLLMSSEITQNDMPCHDETNTSDINHCDGICLCSHIMTSPNAIIYDAHTTMHEKTVFDTPTSLQGILTSRLTTPKGPPPKLFS